MIIVLGSEEEYHSRYVLEKLKEQNYDAQYFDSRKYPLINWDLNGDKSYICLNNDKIFIKDISGIYWRWYFGVQFDNTEIVYREKQSAIESFLYALEPICYNSIQSVELHRKKSYQTKIMLDNGIRVPKTLITNDKTAVDDFYIENDKKVIYKPVRGGAFTQVLKDEDFTRADDIINCPIQLQEFVDGTDIRVYAFSSGEIYAGEILAKSVDFREDKNADIKKFDLPDNIKDDCLKVMRLLGLKYSGIDIRLSKTGEYVFIEANPAPMFVHFENVTGYPITRTLIKNLAGN